MSATIAQLEYRHPDYLFYSGVWSTISDIREGASTFKAKAAYYLPIRPGEDLEVYKHRLTKLSFTPVASNAIRELVAELTAAPRSLEVPNEPDRDFWSKFRDSTDGKGKDESELISNITGSLLFFGRVYLAADNPVAPIPVNNLFQQESLDLRPYLTVFEPLNVTNWGEGWFQTRQVLDVTEPLKKPYKMIRWTYWLPDRTDVYEAELHVDDLGLFSGIKLGDKWITFQDETVKLEPVKSFVHNLGKSLMVGLTLENELWTGNNVYLKQLQHFLIESSWTDSGTLAGIIQRIYKPMPQEATDDPTAVPVERDYSKLINSNAHIMIGADFAFVESEGKAIQSLTSQLNTIEQQIRKIVSQGYASSENEKVVDQSGIAKQVDRATLEKSLQSYGSKIAQLYQDGLQRVAMLANKANNIHFSGLNDYNSDNLTEMLDQTYKMLPMLHLIPPSSLRPWFNKLGFLISGTKSASVEQDIVKEVLKAIPDDFRQMVLDGMLTPKIDPLETTNNTKERQPNKG